jgi:hypothetical protein
VVQGIDTFTWSLATADFNNDGIDDLIQGGYHLATLFSGTPDHGVVLGPTFPELGIAYVTTADLNGDGWMDFIATSECEIDIELLNQADGTFHRTTIPYPPQGGCTNDLHQVRVGDFDGDGRPDLAACALDGVFIYFDDGGAPSYGDPIWITSSGSCDNLAVGDLDGDGTPDIVSVEDAPNSGLSVRLNSADAGFSLTTLSTLCNGAIFGQLVIADLNGDGLPDVVCGTANGIEVRFNQGGGMLGPPVDVATNPPPDWEMNQVVVADLNGDGRPDVLAAGSAGYCDDAGPPAGGAYFFLNDGDGGFALGQALPTGQESVNGIGTVGQPGASLPGIAVGDWCVPDVTIFPNLADAGK